MKKCPFCAEEIMDDAVKCKHCGEMLGTTSNISNLQAPPKAPQNNRRKITVGFVLGWVFGVMLLLAGIGNLPTGNLLPTFISIVMAAILLPPVNRIIQKKTNIHLSRGLKVIILIIGFIALGSVISKNDKHILTESIAVNEATPQVTKIDNKFEVPADATTIFSGIKVTRNNDGGIVVFANAYLPKGTKVWVSPNPVGSKQLSETSEVYVSENGTLQTPSLFNEGAPYKNGKYNLTFLSIFNEIWQTPDVLQLVGLGGKNLPQNMLVPDDKEFPDAGGYIEYNVGVDFPDISLEIQAIEAVKKAKLYVQGSGMSSETIENTIKWFEKSKIFKATKWSAKEAENKNWVVTLSYAEGNKLQFTNEAKWEYNPKTGKVKYIEPNAKMLSYLPPE